MLTIIKKRAISLLLALLIIISLFPSTVFAVEPDMSPAIFLFTENIPHYGVKGPIAGAILAEDGSTPIADAHEKYIVTLFLSLNGYQWYVKPTHAESYTQIYPSGNSESYFSVVPFSSSSDLNAKYFNFYLLPKKFAEDHPSDPAKSLVEEAAIDSICVYRSPDGSCTVTPEREAHITKRAFRRPEIRTDSILVDCDLNFNTNQGTVLTEEEIDNYLSSIAPFTYGVRFFSSTDPNVQTALRLAKEKYNFFTFCTAWIDASETASYREMDALAELALTGYVDGCFVGSEVLHRRKSNPLLPSEKKLIEYVKYVRSKVPADVSVSVADTIDNFTSPALCCASDFIACNVYEYWNGVDINNAAKGFTDAVEGITNACPWKAGDVLVSEVGWPSAGNTVGQAEATEENAAKHFEEVFRYATSAKLPVLFFQASDCLWKKSASNVEAESHFGILDENLVMKKSFEQVFSKIESLRGCLFKYSIVNDCTGKTSARIDGLKVRTYRVDLPDTIGGYPVTCLEGSEFAMTPCFSGHNEVEEIYLPDTLTEIGNNALRDTLFYKTESNWEDGLLYCGRYLIKASSSTPDKIKLHDDTLTISNYCFYGNRSSEIEFNEGLKCIGYAAFEASDFKSICLPDSVDFINSWAWTKSRVQSFEYGNSLTELPGLCFCDCRSLESIHIRSGIKKIHYSTFEGCSSLKSITVDPGNTVYDSRNNCNAIIETAANKLVRGCKSTVIPEGIESLGSQAFDDCYGLTELTIPATVKSFGDYAFANCIGLENVYYNGTLHDWLNLKFASSSSNPAHNTDNLYIDGNLLTDLVIPQDVASVGSYQFSGYDTLRSVTIHDGVTALGDSCFYGTGITDITIPDSVATIGSYAFSYSELANITIGSGIESIGDCVFSWCQNLKSVIIPENVTRIGDYSFSGDDALEYVHIPATVTEISETAFNGHGEDFFICSETADCYAKTYAEENGIEFRVCSGHEEHEHNYVAAVTPPTCTKKGYTTYTCSCGDSYVGDYKNALGHAFGEWQITTPATHTSKGVETRYCSRCDATETRETAKISHTYKTVVTPPTCTQKGYTTYTCSCGDSYVGDYKNALGHAFGEWQVTTPATHTSKGVETRYCSRCDATETRETAKISHTYKTVVTPPTCTQKGYTTYTCSCGDSYVGDYVNALGHIYNAVVTKEPTGTEDGIRTYTCSRCGDHYTEAIPKLADPVIGIRNYTAAKTVDYKATITFTAEVKNAVSGAAVHWFIDGQDKGTGDSCTESKITNSFTVQAKYMKNGKILSESGVEKINVKTGFFAKLLAFFRSIFGALPRLAQGYAGAEMIEKLIP